MYKKIIILLSLFTVNCFGAQPEQLKAKVTIYDVGVNWNTQLAYSATVDDIDSMEYALDKGAQINTVFNNPRRTVLMFAINSNAIKAIKWLLELPLLNVNQEPGQSNPNCALSLAMGLNNIEVFKILLNHHRIDLNRILRFNIQGANETIEAHSALEAAVCMNSMPFAQLIVNKLVKENRPLPAGLNQNTPLHIAAQLGREEFIQLMYDMPTCDINIQDADGQTPLVHAINDSQIDVIVYLLKLPDINLNVQDVNGETALFAAVRIESNSPQIVALLLAHGADHTIINNEGQTACLLAEELDHVTCNKYLSVVEIPLGSLMTDENLLKKYFYYTIIMNEKDLLRVILEDDVSLGSLKTSITTGQRIAHHHNDPVLTNLIANALKRMPVRSARKRASKCLESLKTIPARNGTQNYLVVEAALAVAKKHAGKKPKLTEENTDE